jgi:hypothetical protein
MKQRTAKVPDTAMQIPAWVAVQLAQVCEAFGRHTKRPRGARKPGSCRRFPRPTVRNGTASGA